MLFRWWLSMCCLKKLNCPQWQNNGEKRETKPQNKYGVLPPLLIVAIIWKFCNMNCQLQPTTRHDSFDLFFQLKSVAHLPWRAFMYKVCETFWRISRTWILLLSSTAVCFFFIISIIFLTFSNSLPLNRNSKCSRIVQTKTNCNIGTREIFACDLFLSTPLSSPFLPPPWFPPTFPLHRYPSFPLFLFIHALSSSIV